MLNAACFAHHGPALRQHEGMQKRHSPSFAEMVEDARRAPRAPDGPDGVWLRLGDPTGQTWREVELQISPERARSLVTAGARLAWDDCGSRGWGAPIDWISPAEAAALAAGGEPVLRNDKRHSAGLSAWTSRDGSTLVLASMSVTWGRRLA